MQVVTVVCRHRTSLVAVVSDWEPDKRTVVLDLRIPPGRVIGSAIALGLTIVAFQPLRDWPPLVTGASDPMLSTAHLAEHADWHPPRAQRNHSTGAFRVLGRPLERRVLLLR